MECNIERMEWNHFIIILLLDPYFKIKGWIYEYFGSFSKKFIKSNFIPSHFSKFQEEWKFEVLRKYSGMSVLSYPFYSLPLKLSNRGMDFPFAPLKLPNKGRKKYSKIILFIPFHSIPSSQTRHKKKTSFVYKHSFKRTRAGRAQICGPNWNLRLIRPHIQLSNEVVHSTS